MQRLLRWLPLAIVLVIAAITGVALLGGSDGQVDTEQDAEPVDVRAVGPRFATIDDLVAAADLMVEGVVSAVDTGRTISDPANPQAGVRTRLASLDVTAASPSGTSTAALIVEQEAELLDGTPITVNGVRPLDVGDHVILLLVRGTSDEFPYTTPVNEQAVFYVDGPNDADGGTVRAADAAGVIGAMFDTDPATELLTALGLSSSGD